MPLLPAATAAATEGTHRLLLLPLLLLPARTDGCPLVSDWDCLLHGVWGGMSAEGQGAGLWGGSECVAGGRVRGGR